MYLTSLGASASDAPVLNPLSIPPSIAIGDLTTITCTIKRGSPPVQFKWLHNGIEIQSHVKYKITSTVASSTFLVGQIEATDIGNYSCIASNAFGSDRQTEIVFMEGEKDSENSKILSFYTEIRISSAINVFCNFLKLFIAMYNALFKFWFVALCRLTLIIAS